ncbi:MAG: hypothetical protein D6677_03710 [Calditrichaeota bacterium]|nr:MAG: hypothetical protein D6677_03710 [Calditrichota bacterium]
MTHTKRIAFEVSDSVYKEIEQLAAKHNMPIHTFAEYMTRMFNLSVKDVAPLNLPEAKHTLETDLKSMAHNIEKQQHQLELVLRSIYSTLMRLESQFKQQRLEAANELEKDIERIALFVDSMPNP